MDAPPVSVILKSSSIADTVAWWRAVGFTVTGAVPAEDPTWVEVHRDDLRVQFLAGETPWPDAPTMSGSLYVHPASVEAVHAEIRDRVHCEWGVEVRAWGAVELTVRDPDGYWLTFSQSD